MLLITAPSKTQQPVIREFPIYTFPAFLNESSELIDILRDYSLEGLCSLMKMSTKLGENTLRQIQDFQLPLTPENCSQAIFTFQGDAYSSLTPEKYSEQELQHAQQHVRILSGLYGILRPLDLMHPYRLEMGARLAVGAHTNLYGFWGDKITTSINEVCSQHSDTTLINLASAEYSKVIGKKYLEPHLLTITFRERKGDVYKTIPIHSKRARGMMIHYVISNQLTQATELQQFTLGGYSFADDLSTADTWIFTRD